MRPKKWGYMRETLKVPCSNLMLLKIGEVNVSFNMSSRLGASINLDFSRYFIVKKKVAHLQLDMIRWFVATVRVLISLKLNLWQLARRRRNEKISSACKIQTNVYTLRSVGTIKLRSFIWQMSKVMFILLIFILDPNSQFQNIFSITKKKKRKNQRKWVA